MEKITPLENGNFFSSSLLRPENFSSLDRAIRRVSSRELTVVYQQCLLSFGLFRRAHENAWVGSLGPCAFACVSGTVPVTLETVSISTLSYAVGNQHHTMGVSSPWVSTRRTEPVSTTRLQEPLSLFSTLPLFLPLTHPFSPSHPQCYFFSLVLILWEFIPRIKVAIKVFISSLSLSSSLYLPIVHSKSYYWSIANCICK